MQDLLYLNDPDYASYNTGDPAFLLRAVGEGIRQYCGWHLAPSVTETVDKLDVGSAGIVMLPSLHVTDVSEVVIQANPESVASIVEPSSYSWHKQGYIEPLNNASFRSASGYYYEPGPVFMPVSHHALATVTFTHGYESLPADIKRVAYELAAWAAGLGASGSGGDVKQIKSPGFSLSLGGSVSLGMNLNPDQKRRLSNYRIGGVR